MSVILLLEAVDLLAELLPALAANALSPSADVVVLASFTAFEFDLSRLFWDLIVFVEQVDAIDEDVHVVDKILAVRITAAVFVLAIQAIGEYLRENQNERCNDQRVDKNERDELVPEVEHKVVWLY